MRLTTEDMKWLSDEFRDVRIHTEKVVEKHAANPCSNIVCHEKSLLHKRLTPLGIVLIIITILGGIATIFAITMLK